MLLPQETLPAKGHQEAAPTNWKSATTTEEGFTGDVHCKNCSILLKAGTVVPKIPIVVFRMTTQTEDTYRRNSSLGLIFVSNASLDTFVRVEINGSIVDPQSYVLEEGSTKVTLKPEYLETLPNGKHTVTIVSDAGTASAQFYVDEEEKSGFGTALLIIFIILVILFLLRFVARALLREARRRRRMQRRRYEHRD